MELAHAASDGALGLYVGAGISVPTPTLLPTSGELVARLQPAVQRELGLAPQAVADGAEGEGPADPQLTLEQLADAAEAAGVLPAFREIAAAIAEFRDAPSGYSHRAIGALLREGAATVYSANWDTCIERGAAQIGLHVDPTITDADRAARFAVCRLHKIHGCATQPPTLLVTTTELDAPPDWVGHAVGGALGAITLVFVGLGTVGGYVRRRVEQILEALGAAAAVWLADPYPSRAWKELLDRAVGHVLETDANSFFDDLLRAYVTHNLSRLSDAARQMDQLGQRPPLEPTIDRVVEALDACRALELIGWLRAGAGGVADGSPFLASAECRDSLLALAAISTQVAFSTRGERERLVLMAGDVAIEIAAWPERASRIVVARETVRSNERYEQNCYEGFAPKIVHICVGHRGLLPPRDAMPDIGGGGSPEGDLIESEPTHIWVPAEGVVQGTFEMDLAA